MNATRFWEIIETAWTTDRDLYNLRKTALTTNDPSLIRYLGNIVSTEITDHIQQQLIYLDERELTKFNHVMEEKLFHIDREEIHERIGGTDDGFLHRRCFIVGMGEQYYDMVDENPAVATMNVSSGEIGFIGYSVYQDKFGEEFERYCLHCIESGSNSRGW
ncbi:Protein of unknown function [Chitinophaga sp. YR627]|jgi:hypothetical protein|uniref:DUF4240 domain-containing protein n=1 Tax=Chitinophaga sp. YR627 TaxID=1881041 RepID=UPI0008E2F48D|nr:DUF4240 domain-containing protein [Chitinophaga sp. YR627]SFN99910.1 Protein of unknown function [Chitinophaga sp. YR627]